MEEPQCSSQVQNSINVITTCPTGNNPPNDKLLTVNEFGKPKSQEPEQTLGDEFNDLHLNLPVLEVLAHAPIYNAMLDKYVESLELGKTGPHSSKEKCLSEWKTQGYSLYHVA